MKPLAIAALLILFGVSADAASYGDRNCSIAGVTGRIVRQTTNLGLAGGPLITDGYLHITLNVDRTLFGPPLPKRLEVTRWSRNRLKSPNGKVTLFLNAGRHGWYICERL